MLGFYYEAASVLVKEQELDSPVGMRDDIDKNVNDICNAVKKPGGNNVNEMPDGANDFSLRNLKLAAFLFHHMWRCTFDW